MALPVVSVGNLTLGGTGKTPCVEYVARFYRDLACRVALLSRGYGSAEGSGRDRSYVAPGGVRERIKQGPGPALLSLSAPRES